MATREKSEKDERERERESHGLTSRVHEKSWQLAKSPPPPLGATTSG